MSEAQEPSSYVYQGIWTNWTRGRVTGATLTLSPRNAAVLVAVLALFVQMTGAQFWGVLRFAFHQSRVRSQPEDEFYHQKQAVLRNSSSELGAFWQLFRMSWAWRRQTNRPFMRNLFLMFFALFHFLLFLFAGVFSSKVLEMGEEVLVRSPFCGTFNASYMASLVDRSDRSLYNRRGLEYQAKTQRDADLSQQYVRSCYNTSTTTPSCDIFKKRQLSWQTKLDAVCPFNSSVCLNEAQAILFDTDLLDSQNDLGLNAEEKDRVLYRRTTSCTPLNDMDYATDLTNILPINASTSMEVASAYYGPATGNEYNATFTYSNYTGFTTNDQERLISPYQLKVHYAYSGADFEYLGSFLPIPELKPVDSDIFLVFLLFSEWYETPVDDPWFSAHRTDQVTPLVGGVDDAVTIYGRERPITTLGCAVQHQFCTGNAPSPSNAGNCTPLLGWLQMQTDSRGARALKMTPRQNATYMRIMEASEESNIATMISRLAERDIPLLARGLIQNAVGLSLPSNQWQIETSYWQSLSMAHLQRIFLEYATGQIAVDTSYLQLPSTPEAQWICDNQIVRGTAFESFGVLGLSLILVLGVLIVLMSLFIEHLVAFIQRRSDHGAIRREMWVANETLYLQRMVLAEKARGIE